MISNIAKGNGFRGTLNYDLDKDGAELIGGNMSGRNARELATEFGAVRDHNHRCDNPVFHASLSAPPGERYSDDKWNAVARDYLQGMGFDPDKNQYVAIRHTDREHDHVHIVANRIDSERYKAVDSKHDFRRTQAVCREVEINHGLTRFNAATEPSNNGMLADMRRAISKSINASGGNRDKFIADLKTRGVVVKLNQQSTGRVSGISFVSQNGKTIKGSELGKGYSNGAIEWRLKQMQLGKADDFSIHQSGGTTQPQGGLGGVIKRAGKGLEKAAKAPDKASSDKGSRKAPTTLKGAVRMLKAGMSRGARIGRRAHEM